MSMIGNFRAISPRVLTALRDDPSLVRVVLAVGNEVMPSAGAPPVPMPANVKRAMEMFPEEQRASFLKEYAKTMARYADVVNRIYGTREERSTLLQEAGLTAEECGSEVSIDKAWHGLHFLLCLPELIRRQSKLLFDKVFGLKSFLVLLPDVVFTIGLGKLVSHQSRFSGIFRFRPDVDDVGPFLMFGLNPGFKMPDGGKMLRGVLNRLF